MQRATVPEHLVEIVQTAKDMAPRQPVDKSRASDGNKRPSGSDRTLVRGNHAARDHHGLRRPSAS